MSENCAPEQTVQICVNGRTVDATDPMPVEVIGGGSTAVGVWTTHDDVVADATAGGVEVLAANPLRVGAIVQVLSGGNVRVSLGSDPTASHGVQLVSGGPPLVLGMPYCPTAQIKAIREGGVSGVLSVAEIVPT